MGNLVSHSADELDNRRAPSSTAELPTERDNDAAPALGARPNQEREPAARHNGAKRGATANTDGAPVYALHTLPSPSARRSMPSARLSTTAARACLIHQREPVALRTQHM